MSSLCAWLDSRRPRPPEELERALLEGGDASEGSGSDVLETLTRRARVRLERALARPGRVRESAFELLAADALVTYACEAAVEAPDAEAALVRLLGVGKGT